MKKILTLLFLAIVIFSNAQINPIQFVQPVKFSFLDPNLKTLLNLNLQNFKSQTSSSIPNSTKNVIRNITSEYFEINNKWVSIKDYGVIPLTKSYDFYTSNNLRGIKLQLLNDSLMLVQGGYLLDLTSGKLLYDTIAKRFSPLKLNFNINESNRSGYQLNNNNQIIKSDIFLSELPIVGGDEKTFIYNLFSDSIFSNNKLSDIIDNPNSKYLLTNEGLINRYNVKDFIYHPTYRNDILEYAYNDSLIYFPIKMGGKINLMKIQLNDSLKKDIILNDLQDDYNSDLLRGITDKIIDYSRRSNVLQTWYFHKKYNDIELTNEDLVSKPNYYNTYKSLLTYDPNLIVEYNFITKKVISILDREVYPFKNIEKLFIDKSNRYLIIQQIDNIFTIFDLRQKREILTLTGMISGINYNNELLLNIGAKSAIGYRSGNYVGIILTKLDLNELQKLPESNYVTNIRGLFKFDEFTSKVEFTTSLDNHLNKSSFKKTFPNQIQVVYSNNNITYSNGFIKNHITTTINRFYDTLKNNIGLKTHIYPLKYNSYSIDTKYFEFITENEQHIPKSNGIIYANGSDTPFGQEPYMDRSFKHDFKIDYNKIELSNVNLEEAKSYKTGKYIFVKTSYMFNHFEIPPLTNIFIFRNFPKISNSILKDDWGLTRVNKYFNLFVPFDANLELNYNEWFFGTYDRILRITKLEMSHDPEGPFSSLNN